VNNDIIAIKGSCEQTLKGAFRKGQLLVKGSTLVGHKPYQHTNDD